MECSKLGGWGKLVSKPLACCGIAAIQPPAEMLARSACGWPKIAWRHGGGAEVVHAIKRFIQGGDDARIRQHIKRAARPLNGFLASQHVGPAGRYQH